MNKFEAFKALCEGKTIKNQYDSILFVIKGDANHPYDSTITGSYKNGPVFGTTVGGKKIESTAWGILSSSSYEWEVVPKSGYEEIREIIRGDDDEYADYIAFNKIDQICKREMEKS